MNKAILYLSRVSILTFVKGDNILFSTNLGKNGSVVKEMYTHLSSLDDYELDVVMSPTICDYVSDNNQEINSFTDALGIKRYFCIDKQDLTVLDKVAKELGLKYINLYNEFNLLPKCQSRFSGILVGEFSDGKFYEVFSDGKILDFKISKEYQSKILNRLHKRYNLEFISQFNDSYFTKFTNKYPNFKLIDDTNKYLLSISLMSVDFVPDLELSVSSKVHSIPSETSKNISSGEAQAFDEIAVHADTTVFEEDDLEDEDFEDLGYKEEEEEEEEYVVVDTTPTEVVESSNGLLGSLAFRLTVALALIILAFSIFGKFVLPQIVTTSELKLAEVSSSLDSLNLIDNHIARVTEETNLNPSDADVCKEILSVPIEGIVSSILVNDQKVNVTVLSANELAMNAYLENIQTYIALGDVSNAEKVEMDGNAFTKYVISGDIFTNVSN